MNYDNLTDQQVRDIINEAAKDNPSMLTSALRAAGNFVYLIVPEDITNYDDYQHEGKLKITEEEAAEAITEFGESLADGIPYSDLCSEIADRVLILREEHKNSNPE